MSAATQENPLASAEDCGVPRLLSPKNRLTLSLQIGNNWENLARELDFSEAAIQTIKKDNPGDQNAQIRTMLTDWVNKNAGKPLIQMLVEAFGKPTVKLNTLALALEEAARKGADVVPMLTD